MARKKEAPDVVEQLREAIRNSGQSLNQLSKLTGVGTDRLSRFVRGERTLTLPAVSKICLALHLHLAGVPSTPDVPEGPPPAGATAPKKTRRKKE